MRYLHFGSVRGDLQEGNGCASRCQSPSSRAQNRGFCALLAFGIPIFGQDILQRLSEEVPSLQKTEITKLTMREREMDERGDAEFMRNEDGDVIKYRYDLVTSHTARRSGITNLYLTGLFDTVQMMSISGHKDQRTFFDYIKLSFDEIADKIMEKLRQSENVGNEGLF